MQNKALILLSFLLLTGIAQAQISIGVRAGANLANVSLSDTTDLEIGEPKTRIGSILGAVLEMGITEKLAIQAEPSFIQKGWRVKESTELLGQSFKIDGNYTFNYIDVPILAKLRFNGENTGLYAFAGPTFGYMISGKYKLTTEFAGQKETEEEKLDFDEEEGINRFDVGATLGAGFQLNLGGGRLFFDARYNLGLSNIADEDEVEDEFTIRNKGIGLSVGYLYSF
jgi:hypothetical protein